VLGPLVAPHSPTDTVGLPFSPPSSKALLGTDNLGRDVLSRVLYGGWTVLWMSCTSALLGVGAGVLIGMLAGYTGHKTDAVLMRGMDVLMAFPSIVLVLLFVALLGSKLWLIVLLVGLAWTPPVARVARGITVEARGREFVQAAEVLGMPRRTILLREVLPNLSTPLLVELGLRLTWSIALIAGISFLGFGIQAPQADWGLMVNENRDALAIQPWGAVAPIVMIAIFAIATNLITEGFGRTVAGIDRTPGDA
jgi:peptide/nickel transport system permease protein